MLDLFGRARRFAPPTPVQITQAARKKHLIRLLAEHGVVLRDNRNATEFCAEAAAGLIRIVFARADVARPVFNTDSAGFAVCLFCMAFCRYLIPTPAD